MYEANESCRSEEQTSELQSLMRISYAVFCLKKKKKIKIQKKIKTYNTQNKHKKINHKNTNIINITKKESKITLKTILETLITINNHTTTKNKKIKKTQYNKSANSKHI